MALTQALCTSFKVELFKGTHNFTLTTGNVFKCALFKGTASIAGTFGAATTNYSAMGTDENAGTLYTATGNTLTNVTPIADGTTAICDFADTTWAGATITSRGALLYNSTAGGNAVGVIDFLADKVSTAGDFSIIWPAAAAATAIIRIV